MDSTTLGMKTIAIGEVESYLPELLRYFGALFFSKYRTAY